MVLEQVFIIIFISIGISNAFICCLLLLLLLLVRDLSLFYKLFLIDPVARKAVLLCPFVKTGIMHREFTPYLQSNHLGIDYSATALQQYDTKTKINQQLERQHPYWEQRIREAQQDHNRVALQDAIQNAKRVGLDKKKPELIANALIALQSI